MSLLFTWDKIVLQFKEQMGEEIGDLLFYKSQIIENDSDNVVVQVDDLAFSLLRNKNTKNYQMIEKLIKNYFGENNSVVVTTKNEPLSLENQPRGKKMLKHQENQTYKQTNLIANYTFDNFFYSYDNRKIIEACRQVTEEIKLGQTPLSFNPLFIYGASGIGKTHLISALRNEIFKNMPEKKILYKNATEFLNDYSNLFKGSLNNTKNIDEFKEMYFNLDVLIIDDIQMLKTKEGTLNEFFSIFEHLRMHDKTIIITSDINPKELNFQERLLTRFLSGLVTQINYPDSDTKTQIFKYHAHNMNLNITESAIEIFIESSKHVRELLGYFSSIKADLITTGIEEEITKQKAIEIVSRLTTTPATATKEDIIKIICNYFDVEFNELQKKSRKQTILLPRNFCIYFLRTRLNLTYVVISKEFGMKDHTNCVKIVKEFEKHKNKNKKAYDIISQKINNLRL